MKPILVIAGLLFGAAVGWQLGEWWLDRTIKSPELETAIYPAIGAIGGALVGVALGGWIAYLSGRREPG